MKLKRAVGLLFLGFLSCSGSFFDEDPGDDPETVFEHFWESYDRYYAHFELKEIDWDQIYRQYRPKVGPETSPEALFEILAEMIRFLEDGHVYLIAEKRRALSDGHLRVGPRNFNAELIEKDYLGENARERGEGRFVYGILEGELGYLRLSTLAGGNGRGEEVTGWITEVDEILEELAGTRGLILDLRNNGGGRAYNTKYIAARFASAERPFVITRSRSGPGHDQFSSPRTWYARPLERGRYTAPVVVVTNRFTFSAAEWLTLALRQYDHITHLGTYTGGGLAMFLPRELPNGWTYTISVQDTRAPDGTSFERVGIRPEISVEMSDSDRESGRDSLLEAAMDHLLSEKSSGPQRVMIRAFEISCFERRGQIPGPNPRRCFARRESCSRRTQWRADP